MNRLFFFTSVLFLLFIFSAIPARAQLFNPYPNCDYPSFCYYPLPFSIDNVLGNFKGGPCSIPGVTDGHSYQYETQSCQPPNQGNCPVQCGFLSQGACCAPVNKSDIPPQPPANLKKPPCNATSSNKCTAVDTAIGIIQTDIAGFTSNIYGILLSLSGGVAILLIIAAGYEMATSQGNPEKVKAARERLTATIVGLFFIIFSVTILQIIGIDILHIPGFSK